MRATNWLRAFAMTIFSAAAAFAQTSAPASPNIKSPVSAVYAAPDRDFLDKAFQSCMAQTELAEQAEQNAGSNKVREFGLRQMQDGGRVNYELEAIAEKENVSPPQALSAQDRSAKDQIANLHGAEFDKAYVADVVSQYEDEIAEFKDAGLTAHNPEVQAWARKTLLTLESQLQEAKKLVAYVNSTESSPN
jgi:putative membrane protein